MTTTPDYASSASRQHYIDTGHLLFTDGTCLCDDDLFNTCRPAPVDGGLTRIEGPEEEFRSILRMLPPAPVFRTFDHAYRAGHEIGCLFDNDRLSVYANNRHTDAVHHGIKALAFHGYTLDYRVNMWNAWRDGWQDAARGLDVQR